MTLSHILSVSMKTYFILQVLLLAIVNLSFGKVKVPQYIVENFSNCIDDECDHIKSVLDINGFYRMAELKRWSSGYKDSFRSYDSSIFNIIFYKNGLYLFGFCGSTETSVEDVKTYLSSEYRDSRPNRLFVSSGTWGAYKILHDTLIMQSIYNVGSPIMASWRAWEQKYKIIDRRTIEQIPSSTRALYKQDRDTRISSEKAFASESYTLPSKFIEYDSIPPPNCWLKKESWIWCNKRKE